MARSSVALFALLAVSTASLGAVHGIQPDDIDRNAKPCEDFFAYANGAWRQKNPIPDYMDRWSRRWQSGELNKERVRDILAELSARQDWPQGSAGQLAGDFYAACMDESAANARGVEPLRPWLAQIDAITDRAGLQREIARLNDAGIAAPFAILAAEDPREPTRTIAHINADGLGLPDRDYYLKPEPRFAEARTRYLAHVAKVFELAGVPAADAARDAQTVFEFEKRLAQASLDNVQLRDPKRQDNPTTFAGLSKLAPGFDWGAYFEHAGLPRVALNVGEPAFLRQFDKELTGAPLAQWKAYLRWHVLNTAADALSQPFVDENFAFNGQFLTGATQIKPRWKRCAELADAQLGDALGQKYVEKYFPPQAKARMQEMVKNILAAMDDTIGELDWMDAQTKRKALEKRSTFVAKLGYPDKFKDYAGVEVSRASAWNNLVATSRWNVADERRLVGKPTDRGRWGMTPPTSNAYYNPLQNEIVFPAGILQPPAFDVDATDAVNYGAIGVVIGHEISHGFDDQGAQFDAQGRLKNWWTPADGKQFAAKGQCVVDQFEGYFIEPGLHHNGKLVLGESIGDLAGAKIAYRAYLKSREGKGPEPTLDGFTPEQQFFIAWGQFRGDETRLETQRTMIQGDPHPVAKYRVNGPLSNLPAFQQTFQCKAGDAMVRAEELRCEVW
ncbi:M13 family metallopeptidase [Lysobacter enzymogenes]|uniref:Endothelin-converting protein 1 n=1 Tax=Lysobacter enzymogenes TaxID=69 RepID=A0AAU9AW92_LYSEN|nr:M13 family metallopeptidase [Lysobacter enzymogenes]BAV98502.1 endothelin-converting protein 1 [Lysobacter enzymogenes]